MQDGKQQESTAYPPSISSGERGSAAAPPPTEAAAEAVAAVAGGPGTQVEGSYEGSAGGSKTKESSANPLEIVQAQGQTACKLLEKVRACGCLRVSG